MSRMTRRKAVGLLAVSPAMLGQSQPATKHGSMLWNYVVGAIQSLDENRRARLASLRTPAELHTLQENVRARLAEMWGAFPARTPLNAKVVGRLERPDYLIEKVIFESRPRFYVTANLYRPAQAEGRLPAVIFPLGHTDDGKAAASYQRFCILLAREGFIVLTWDPIGQGERVQLYDPATKTAPAGRSTGEHRALGNQCYLLGMNLMHYRAWDAVRAIDYLESRSEVDPRRIACVGQSGGGMETLQFAPFEKRLAAAVPVCAVATFRGKTEALLIADAEQILAGTLGYGIDHPELLASVAPRPLLIGSAIRDYVPISAARSTYHELKPVYAIFDQPQKLAMAETDDKHSLNQEMREAIATFLNRWLVGKEKKVRELPSEIASEEELRCTVSGQVVASLPGETVLSLNRAQAERIAPRRTTPAGKPEVEAYRFEIAKQIREITKVGPVAPESGIVVPTREFNLEAGKRTMLVVAEKGKDDPELARIVITPLVSAGWHVVAIDVRGWGATTPYMPERQTRTDGTKIRMAWDEFFAYRSLELGRPLFGQRLRDTLVAASDLRQPEIAILGAGAGALLAVYAAVLEPRFRTVVSIGGLLSYRSLIDDPLQRHPTSILLPGVLRAYDLRDVYAAIAGRRLLVINPQDARRVPVPRDVAEAELGWTEQVFRAAGSQESLSVHCGITDGDLPGNLASWLRP